MSDQKDEIRERDEQAKEFESSYLPRGYYYNWIEKETVIIALVLIFKSSFILLQNSMHTYQKPNFLLVREFLACKGVE